MDAALKVFAAHGVDGGTIRRIAGEAGVAEGLIYHYFESKEALLDAVVRGRSLLPWLEGPEALPDDWPVGAVLRRLVLEGLSRLERNAEVFLLVWSQIPMNPRMAERMGRFVRDVSDRIAAYLDRKIARAELRPVDTHVAARLLMGSMVTFALAQERLSPPLRHLSPEHFADALVDIIVSGLTPGGQGADRPLPLRERGLAEDVE